MWFMVYPLDRLSIPSGIAMRVNARIGMDTRLHLQTRRG